MAFVDELKIYAKAGNGGNGIVSWRQEKFRPLGGPAGGDGGNGASVHFIAVRDLSILRNYTSKPEFKAERGGDGRRLSKEGKNGEDLYIKVPVGSRVTNIETGEEFQLLKEGEERHILQGGRGGCGNEHFKSSTNTTPQEQTDGTVGEEANYRIELELLVDLGLVGLPSAGKSSLMNTLTESTAKVGDYPFTTLEPGLGMFHHFVIADIPGLIEGASEGKGLGYKFLRHIKRTKAIAHLVSFEYEDMQKEYETIRNELIKYSPELGEKAELILLSKSDLVTEEEAEAKVKEFKKKYKKEVLAISIINDESMKVLGGELSRFLED